MISKPYYRIYRRNINGSDLFVLDDEYCEERIDLIKYYNFLQKQVVELFDYIEPNEDNLRTYSNKNYQLLTNICMEVENNLKGILLKNEYVCDEKKIKKLNMEDYRKLEKLLKLSEYKILLNCGFDKVIFTPFENFAIENKGLEWYQDYNSIKHNRTQSIKKANLRNVLEALGGLYILLKSQFACFTSCTTNKTTLLTYIELQNGVYNSNVSLPIFDIYEKPSWEEDELYNFNWEELKNEKVKFDKFFQK